MHSAAVDAVYSAKSDILFTYGLEITNSFDYERRDLDFRIAREKLWRNALCPAQNGSVNSELHAFSGYAALTMQPL